MCVLIDNSNYTIPPPPPPLSLLIIRPRFKPLLFGVGDMRARVCVCVNSFSLSVSVFFFWCVVYECPNAMLYSDFFFRYRKNNVVCQHCVCVCVRACTVYSVYKNQNKKCFLFSVLIFLFHSGRHCVCVCVCVCGSMYTHCIHELALALALMSHCRCRFCVYVF